MSNDLISRKALIERLDYYFQHTDKEEHYAYQVAIKEVREAPTVFDKEKVIDQLKEASYWESADIYDDDGYRDDYYDLEVIGLDEAIEIVEKGGVE